MEQNNVLSSVMEIAAAIRAAVCVVSRDAILFRSSAGGPMRRYIVNIFGTRDGRLRALRIVQRHRGQSVELSHHGDDHQSGVGIVATLVTWALGFPTPLLWGALAFALNYIPYVGPGIMHVILFMIGLLTFDTLWLALIAPLFFMAFTFVEGHFIVPNVVGRQLLCTRSRCFSRSPSGPGCGDRSARSWRRRS